MSNISFSSKRVHDHSTSNTWQNEVSGYRRVAKDQPQRNITQSDGSFKLLSSKEFHSTLTRRYVNVFLSAKFDLIELSRARREANEEKADALERAGVIKRAVDVAADKILVLDLDDNEECELLFTFLIIVHYTITRADDAPEAVLYRTTKTSSSREVCLSLMSFATSISLLILLLFGAATTLLHSAIKHRQRK